MLIKKGDTVLIISGKDKGKKAKVLRCFPKTGRVLAEGVNLRKKHQRSKKGGEKGQIIELPVPLAVSNVQIICSKCAKAARIGFKIVDNKKYRICRKCEQEI